LALGHYRTEEELLTEAVHLLSQRNALREQIAAGTRELANGEYTDYDPQALRQRRVPLAPPVLFLNHSRSRIVSGKRAACAQHSMLERELLVPAARPSH
jgi:hypothetical protein